MTSSIEETFQPPEWATRDEVIKAAQHYINYWRIEAKTSNGQWLEALKENASLKAEVERLKAELSNITGWGRGLESDLCRARAELMLEKAEVERIRLIAHDNKQALYNANAQVERLTKAGDAMAEEIALAKRQDEGSKFDPIEMHYDHKLIVKWNAAKQGGQP